jgi:hypothetical protein
MAASFSRLAFRSVARRSAKITDIHVVRAIASLTEPAERSVRQWTFQAAKLDGEPVSSRIVVAFSFVPPNVGPRI